MDAGLTDSPPPRTTILGSFLGRGRPRNSSQSHIDVAAATREMSPSPPAQPPSPRRRNPPPPVQTTPSLGLSHMLRRRRSAGAIASPAPPTVVPAVPPPRSATQPLNIPPPAVNPNPNGNGGGGTHRIRLVPHLDSRRSLRFDPIARDLREGDAALRIGRFTDRSGLGLAAVNALSTNKIAFKSKVVSRAHAEVWVEAAPGPARFFIRDTKSSSGTFLNHVRLSPANTESRPHQIKDGDILQLGVDYQGGAEDIYKSVKIRVELGREWQAAANAFNTNALRNLKTLAIGNPPSGPATALPSPNTQAGASASAAGGGGGKAKKGGAGGLFPVSIRQALFIAPCSHTFHYKCLRPLLEAHHPAFSCPLCRTFADLEEDVEVEEEFNELGGETDDEGALTGAATGMEDGAEDEPLPLVRVEGAGAETEVEDAGTGPGGDAMDEDADVDMLEEGGLHDLVLVGDQDGEGEHDGDGGEAEEGEASGSGGSAESAGMVGGGMGAKRKR
ncbi:hypothetical protein B0H10DRAFT_1990862 [Mycena sp. CBHHK59/15]|nr:hypothetical protein B0H10DRAFT_1990862 [Mycena sp. CBHHK59/15]